MRRSLICGAIAALCVGAAGCRWEKVSLIKRGDRHSPKKVLVATERTPYKDAVTAPLVEDLVKDGCYVKVIDLGDLDAEVVESYQAIVVMNSCWLMSLDLKAERFVDRTPDPEKDKVILLTTSMGWEADVPRVDAVSSASDVNKALEMSETLAEKVRAVVVRHTR